MRYFVIIICTSIITFSVTFLLMNNNKPKVNTNVIQSKFYSILNIDINEYLELKQEQEKYKKADEILGKILLIFMADLGIKLNKTQNFLPIPDQTAKTVQTNAPGNTPVTIQENISEQKIQPTPNKNLIPNSKWVANENKINNLNSDDEIKNFLENVKFDNIPETLRTMKPLQKLEGNANQILGKYVGEIVFFEKNKSPLKVETSFKFSEQFKDSVDYQIHIFGNSPLATGTGGTTNINNIFNIFENGSKAIIIEIMKSYSYLQLYYLEDKGIFIGNVYRSIAPGEYKAEGTIKLEPI